MSKKSSHDIIGSVYASFLNLDTHEREIQEKIYNYGIRSNDDSLLSKLALIEDLEPEIDAKLKDAPGVSVKAAWASRPGRSEDEISKLLEKEKRVKVLTSLAERDDLPEVVYKTIATKSKGIGALVSLLSNAKVPFSIKEIAAVKLTELYGSDYDAESSNSKRIQEITNILAQNPELCVVIANSTDNINVLYGVAKMGPLNELSQKKLIEILKKSITISEKKERTSWDKVSSSTFSYLVSIGDVLLNHGSLTEESKKDYLDIVKSVLKKYPEEKSSYYGTQLNNTIENIKKSRKITRPSFHEMIKNAKNNSEIDKIVDLILEDYSKNRDYQFTESVALALIGSPHSNAEQTARLLEDCYFTWSQMRQIHKLTDDIEKLGVILTRTTYLGVDNTISNLSKPEEVLSAALKHLSSKGHVHYIPQELLNSKYLNEKVAVELPLHAFLHEATPLFVRNYLANILKTELTTDEEWIVFESLGKEFEGSISELIKLVKSL